MPSLNQLSATIEAIYDAGRQDAQWGRALERLASLLGSTAATVAFQDSATRFPAYYSIRYDSNSVRAYAEHYRRVDPVLAFVSRTPVGVHGDGMFMPKTDLRRMEIHSDFGLANDMDVSVKKPQVFDTPCLILQARLPPEFSLKSIRCL